MQRENLVLRTENGLTHFAKGGIQTPITFKKEGFEFIEKLYQSRLISINNALHLMEELEGTEHPYDDKEVSSTKSIVHIAIVKELLRADLNNDLPKMLWFKSCMQFGIIIGKDFISEPIFAKKSGIEIVLGIYNNDKLSSHQRSLFCQSINHFAPFFMDTEFIEHSEEIE